MNESASWQFKEGMEKALSEQIDKVKSKPWARIFSFRFLNNEKTQYFTKVSDNPVKLYWRGDMRRSSVNWANIGKENCLDFMPTVVSDLSRSLKTQIFRTTNFNATDDDILKSIDSRLKVSSGEMTWVSKGKREKLENYFGGFWYGMYDFGGKFDCFGKDVFGFEDGSVEVTIGPVCCCVNTGLIQQPDNDIYDLAVGEYYILVKVDKSKTVVFDGSL